MGSKHRKKLNRVFKPPSDASTKVTQFSPQQIAAMTALMQQNTAPQATPATAFSPGTPIVPTPGIVTKDGPRNWQFPIGYNIGQLPRSTESTPFETLRNLAALYDGILLCEQALFDLCSKLQLELTPTKAALDAVDGDETVFADDIARYKEWFEFPDKDNDLDLKSWIRMGLRERMEIDALAIYVRPNRGGGVYSLELIDGATLKPLIDERGRKPQPPYPAYQQFWQGLPLGWYTSDQMIYHRETARADSVYGLSRVERIIMRVNQALRKQNKDMARFTEGNLPPGILEMPANPENEWTPDQILLYQQVWDGLLAGNDATRMKVRVVEPGAKFTAIADPDIMTPFDSFLLNVTVACFGLTMAELGFTENVNKSSGDSQEDVTYRRALRPSMNMFAELFTLILRKYFKENRFVVGWSGFEKADDISALSTAYGNLVKIGVISPPMAAKLMKLPSEEGEIPIPRYFATATGPVFFDDLLDPELRKAQKAAQMKGYELAQQGQQAQGQSGKSNPFQKNDNPDESHEKSEGDEGSGKVPNDGGKHDEEAARAALADIKRWRECAIKDVRNRKPVRAFASDVIAPMEHHRLTSALSICETVEDVKLMFEVQRAKNTDDSGSWQLTDSDTLKQLAQIQARGTTHLRWDDHPGACDECQRNAGVTVRIGEQFPTGALCTPGHDHCLCKTTELILSEAKAA